MKSLKFNFNIDIFLKFEQKFIHICLKTNNLPRNINILGINNIKSNIN